MKINRSNLQRLRRAAARVDNTLTKDCLELCDYLCFSEDSDDLPNEHRSVPIYISDTIINKCFLSGIGKRPTYILVSVHDEKLCFFLNN